MSNPYAFVVGCPRSGTTLLQRMLDAHPLLTMANDTHFITRALDDGIVGGDPRLTPAIVEQVRTYRRFNRLGLPDADVIAAAAGADTYSEFVGGLYDRLAARRSTRWAGEKTPGYVRHIPWLHELFPWARTVHIIRDGRDVTLSALDWATRKGRERGPARRSLWRTNPIAACALWWRWQVASGREGGTSIPGRYLEVRYEHLVADSVAAMEGVLAFLDLPWAPEVLNFNTERARPGSARSVKNAWLAPTPGVRDWRSEMAGRDLELFDALAGDMLEELGYERAHRSVSPAITELAARSRRRWADDQARWRAGVARPAIDH